MAKYKVIALSVGTMNGVKSAGDVVSDTDFPKGHAELLVEKDFLKKLDEKKKESSKKDTSKAK